MAPYSGAYSTWLETQPALNRPPVLAGTIGCDLMVGSFVVVENEEDEEIGRIISIRGDQVEINIFQTLFNTSGDTLGHINVLRETSWPAVYFPELAQTMDRLRCTRSAIIAVAFAFTLDQLKQQPHIVWSAGISYVYLIRYHFCYQPTRLIPFDEEDVVAEIVWKRLGVK